MFCYRRSSHKRHVTTRQLTASEGYYHFNPSRLFPCGVKRRFGKLDRRGPLRGGTFPEIPLFNRVGIPLCIRLIMRPGCKLQMR
jgi:hypothetical protein